MQQAIELAQHAVESGAGGPFGALIVRGDEVLASGHNRVLAHRDPTAHAEVCAIRAACQATGEVHLHGTHLYTSCEPCPMCLAAAHWAHIGHIWYAGTRDDAARIGFDDEHFYSQLSLPASQRAMPAHEFMREAAQPAFDSWLARPQREAY